MITKSKNIKLVLLLISVNSFVSCNAQQDTSVNRDYEPYTEHQYYIKAKNDTLLLHLFKASMLKEDINNCKDGKVLLEVQIDITGNVTDVDFKKIAQQIDLEFETV